MAVYPFKLLDAYKKDDKDLFFGRAEEINSLYEMTFQTNILLVYGASGTGKTSLIQCGLASKFETHEWLPLNVRRAANLNDSLEKVISDAAGKFNSVISKFDWLEEDSEVQPQSPLEKKFKAIYLRHFRPIYLIFDQFEELYTLGSHDEQIAFVQTVRDILQVQQPVKIILSIREEYLANLYEFEKAVPQLLRKKIRIEPMNLDKVRQVITGMTRNKNTNVHLAETEIPGFTETLFDKIRGKEKTLVIQLPYLQVFLDKLYLSITGDEDRVKDAEFSTATLTKFGSLGDVLRNFLDEQVNAVQEILRSQKMNVSIDTIWKILSPFATLEGTKEPICLEHIKGKLQNDVAGNVVEAAVIALTSRRILRYQPNDNLYEIAHDSLGVEIAKRRSPEEEKILISERTIRNKLSSRAGGIDYLTAGQLEYIKQVEDKLDLNVEERELLRTSRKKLRRRSFIQKATMLAIFLILLSFTIFSYYQKRVADDAKTKALVAKQAAEDSKRAIDIALEKEKAAFSQEKIAKQQADSARQVAIQYAEMSKRTADQLKIEIAATQSANRIAEEKTAEANRARLSADNARNREYQQRMIADSLSKSATQAANISNSRRLALQSIASENPGEKIVSALQAYYLNKSSNENAWMPELTEALIKAVRSYSIDTLVQLRSSILDIVNTGNGIVLITDAGEIRNFDLKSNKADVVWAKKDFHYVNNSAQYDIEKNELLLRDINNITYVVPLNNISNTRKRDYSEAYLNSFLLSRNDLLLTNKNLMRTIGDNQKPIFDFQPNFPSAFEKTTDGKIVAAGTRNGWLYVIGNTDTTDVDFGKQFQNPGTQVSDITFDASGKFIATAGTDSKFRITTLQLLKDRSPIEIDFKSWVNCILFLPNEKVLIGTAAGKLYQLNYDQNALAKECYKRLKNNKEAVDELKRESPELYKFLGL